MSVSYGVCDTKEQEFGFVLPSATVVTAVMGLHLNVSLVELAYCCLESNMYGFVITCAENEILSDYVVLKSDCVRSI